MIFICFFVSQMRDSKDLKIRPKQRKNATKSLSKENVDLDVAHRYW